MNRRHSHRILITAALATFSLAAAACGGSDEAAETTEAPTETAAPAPADEPSRG